MKYDRRDGLPDGTYQENPDGTYSPAVPIGHVGPSWTLPMLWAAFKRRFTR